MLVRHTRILIKNPYMNSYPYLPDKREFWLANIVWLNISGHFYNYYEREKKWVLFAIDFYESQKKHINTTYLLKQLMY